MSIEDRFRAFSGAVLRAEAGSAAQPTEAKWDAIRSRSSKIRTRRNRGRVAVIGLSSAAVIIAAVALFFSRPGEDRRKITDQPSGAGPAYVVTVEDGAVLVRSAANGELLRVLAENEDSRNAEKVAVSPDGSQVYFTRQVERDCPGPNDLGIEIVRVPIGGGPLDVVVDNGSSPAVSPTGSYLAYTTNGSPDGCVGGEHHLMRRTIGVDDSDTTMSAASSDGSALFPNSWSKDESVLLAEGHPPTDMRRELFTIEGLPDDPRTTRVRFPDQRPGALEGPAVLLGPRLVAAPVELDGRWFVVSFDPKTGDVQERLFEVAKRPEYLEVDASGQRFLVGVEAEIGYTLYRWDAERGLKSFGDHKLRDMAWARGPTKLPEYLVVANSEYKLQIRKTADGSVVRELGEVDVKGKSGFSETIGFPPLLAPSPDGRWLYLARSVPNELCDSPGAMAQIDRIDLTQPDSIDSHLAMGGGPAVSPDGRKLAYVTSSTDCGPHDILVVREIESGQEQRWSAGDSFTAAMPHWSPDSRLISVTLADVSGDSVRLLDTLEPEGPLLTDQPVMPFEYTALHSYLTEDEIVAMHAIEDSLDIITVDPSGGLQIRFLYSIPGWAGARSLSVDASGEHLLVLREQPDPTLVSYSVGNLETRNLGDDVIAAAWLHRLPDAGPPVDTASPTAREAPDTIVAASATVRSSRSILRPVT